VVESTKLQNSFDGVCPDSSRDDYGGDELTAVQTTVPTGSS